MKANYVRLGAEKMAALLPGRSVPAILAKAKRLGLLRTHFTYWTSREIKTLIWLKLHGATNAQLVAALPRHTWPAINNKETKLGLVHRKNWSDEETEILRDAAPGLACDDPRWKTLLPRWNHKQILEKAYHEGIHFCHAPGARWTGREKAALRYGQLHRMTYRQIKAKLLPYRGLQDIEDVASYLGYLHGHHGPNEWSRTESYKLYARPGWKPTDPRWQQVLPGRTPDAIRQKRRRHDFLKQHSYRRETRQTQAAA